MENQHSDRMAKLIQSLTTVLNEIIEENTAAGNQGDKKFKIGVNKKSLFYAKSPPSIAIDQYLERILKYTKIEDSTLIISLIYIDRICDLKGYELSLNNIHRYHRII